MSSMSAKSVARASLPVIDVSGLTAPDMFSRKHVAVQIREACLDKGFFYISGHGVGSELIEATVTASRALFSLPMPAKMKLDLKASKASRGYEPLQAQTLETGAPPDLKEGFYIGTEAEPEDPRVLAGEYKLGPNQWPAELPQFRPLMNRYFLEVGLLGERLMRGIALSLDLEEEYFSDFCKGALKRLRLLHYPPQPASAAPGQKGVGAHTDFGGLTILLQDPSGGLQVYDQATSSWLHADPIEGTYVVNLGDLIARWTNDLYRSTLHRVINTSGRDRYSVPFFFHGNPQYVVSCLPNCCAPGQKLNYPVATVQQHFEERYQRSYAAAG
jgi:isopenicillin N synthase-like dioxygenase